MDNCPTTTFLKPFFEVWILSASSSNVSRFESDEHCKNRNKQNNKQDNEAKSNMFSNHKLLTLWEWQQIEESTNFHQQVSKENSEGVFALGDYQQRC